jgi:hypothetical protein
MSEPPTSDEEENEEQASHRAEAVIPREGALSKGSAQEPIEPDLSEVAAEDLETRIGGERLRGELDPEIAVDSAAEKAFPLSHLEWAFLSGLGSFRHFPKNRKGAHFQALSA